MIVCIAEKPSVARDIADVLGAKEKKDGYANAHRPFLTFNVSDYSSSNKISNIWQAALATGVPGPKMAATPAL